MLIAGELDELIDLELQLAKDRSSAPEELLRRDRGIAQDIGFKDEISGLSGEARQSLLRLWLKAASRGEPSRGADVGRAVALTQKALVLAGLLIGGSAMAVLLHYDGSTPINVVNAIGVFVGLQLMVLIALLLHLRHTPGEGFFLGRSLLHELVRFAVFARTRLGGGQDSGPALPAGQTLGRLFARRYSRIETWLVVRATQTFGIAFNAGALGIGLYLVAFTDLAFAWATTLKLEPAQLHVFTQILSFPWAWLETARPGLSLIEATQYFRLDQHYKSAVDPALVGSWWPFLFCCIIVYGLLPRLLLFFWASLRCRAALGPGVFEGIELDQVWQRLSLGVTGREEQNADPTHAASPGQRATLAGQTLLSGSAVMLLWRDLPVSTELAQSYLAERFGTEVKRAALAGGRAADFDAEAASALFSGLPRTCRGLILVESFSAFDKTLQRFIRGLRERLGPERPLVIVLVDVVGGELHKVANAAQVKIWRQCVAEHVDRQLGLET